jgi:hypothetical protein
VGEADLVARARVDHRHAQRAAAEIGGIGIGELRRAGDLDREVRAFVID